MTTAALLLAAGGGHRFAGPTHKLLTRFRGRPLVCWALDAAAALDELIVVTGAFDLPVPAEATVVRNDRWRDGQASSLVVGIAGAAAAGHRAVVVGLADQPLVPAAAWRSVAAADATPMAVATYGGAWRNPVRLDESVWPLLPATGDEGARRVLRSNPHLVTEVPCPGDPADIDTVDDLVARSPGIVGTDR